MRKQRVYGLILLLSLVLSIPAVAAVREAADTVIQSDLPQGITVDYGESRTISVSASVDGRYTAQYIWHVDGKIDETVTSGSYNTEGLSVGGHNIYCEVYGQKTDVRNGDLLKTSVAVSRACHVTVQPAIHEEYDNMVSVRRGESHLLTITVSESERHTFAFTWFVNGSEDTSSATTSFDTKHLGEGSYEIYCQVQVNQKGGGAWCQKNSKVCYVTVSPSSSGSIGRFERVATFGEDTFRDVVSTDWFSGYVRDAFEMGLISGKGEGRFAPNEPFTVAEAVKIASCIHSIYYTGAVPEKYGDSGPWYTSYVNYASRNGILESTDSFDYTKPCTRSQMACLFSRCLPKEQLSHLRDVSRIPDCDQNVKYYDSILTLYEAGVVSGDTDHNYHPYNEIKRSEAAKIICTMVLPELRDSVSF